MRLLSVVLVLSASLAKAQTPAVSSVVNAASLDTRLAPGCVATVSGVNLGTGDATVTIGGVTAPVIIDLGNKLNIQIPFELSSGPANLTITVNGNPSAPFSLNLDDYAPGLVTGAGGTDATLGTFTNPSGAFVTTANPATPTQVITLYATGLGPTNPKVPSGYVNTGAPTATRPAVTVEGETALVTASALSSTVFGYYQVNFKVPADLPVGNHPVVLTIGGQTSNAVLMPVGKPLPLILNVVNSGSFAAANVVAPGELIAINGGNMGATDNTSLYPATSSEGISVTLDNEPVPLFYLLPSVSRVYAIVPSDIPETGNGNLVVTNAIGTGSIAVRQASAAPGIFRVQDPSKPTRLNAAAIFGNTGWLVIPTSMAAALHLPSVCKSTVSPTTPCGQPATIGDAIQVYVTGLGKVTPNGDPAGTPLATGAVAPANGNPIYETILKPTVTVGGVSTPVLFSGMTPGFAGLYQVNFQIPQKAPSGDDVAVVVSVPGFGSDSATISIH
jgi:uncharacterized protein (TIGR03437 family)